MYKISKDNRDAIVTYLLNSVLPSGEVQKIAKVLNSLEEIEEKKD